MHEAQYIISRMYKKRPTICTDCTAPLFYVLAPTCFGSSLPSSGSLLDPSELLKIQIGRVEYHIMCGYVACVPDYRDSVRRQTGHVTTRPICISSNSGGSNKLPDDSRLLPKHVGAST
jgi:hypothetical protein